MKPNAESLDCRAKLIGVHDRGSDPPAVVTALSEPADGVVVIDMRTRRRTVLPYPALRLDSGEIQPVLRAICALNPDAAISGRLSKESVAALQRHGIRVADSVAHEIGRALREAL